MSHPHSDLAAPGQMHRLKRTGTPFKILVNGESIAAFAGETVLTTLLTARFFVRRFEFGGEPRAGFCCIGACQDCWVHLIDGTPIRACTTEVKPGMEIKTDGAD